MARLGQIAGTLEDSARDAQLVGLKLVSPMRAPAGRPIVDQADAGHLPLFVAADQPVLI